MATIEFGQFVEVIKAAGIVMWKLATTPTPSGAEVSFYQNARTAFNESFPPPTAPTLNTDQRRAIEINRQDKWAEIKEYLNRDYIAPGNITADPQELVSKLLASQQPTSNQE